MIVCQHPRTGVCLSPCLTMLCLVAGPGATTATWLRDRGLVWRRRRLVSVQRVHPAARAPEISARTPDEQDKTGAAGLEPNPRNCLTDFQKNGP